MSPFCQCSQMTTCLQRPPLVMVFTCFFHVSGAVRLLAVLSAAFTIGCMMTIDNHTPKTRAHEPSDVQLLGPFRAARRLTARLSKHRRLAC